MKQHLKKLLILIPLVLIATGVFAAYTFVAPTSAPTANNTAGPLDISANNQVKNGGLAVNTFQSRTGSQFAQQTQFTGLVNGGTAGSTNSTITLGNASDVTSINETGNVAVANYYQSDSLKTGGGNKPICADSNGVFSLCGTSGSTGGGTLPVYLRAEILTGNTGRFSVDTTLSEPITSTVSATISATLIPGGIGPVGLGTCPYNSTPTIVGTLDITATTVISSSTLSLPGGCSSGNTALQISSYSPQTTRQGRPIKAQ
ncbi:MAG TPA: hypothetical protein VL576_01390 [Candidatus Paceibacterota bacterium]|jgi:hypothetical protein|nr:hypothetical protein [Candidatus Paceibacterota bacterium]